MVRLDIPCADRERDRTHGNHKLLYSIRELFNCPVTSANLLGESATMKAGVRITSKTLRVSH